MLKQGRADPTDVTQNHQKAGSANGCDLKWPQVFVLTALVTNWPLFGIATVCGVHIPTPLVFCSLTAAGVAGFMAFGRAVPFTKLSWSRRPRSDAEGDTSHLGATLSLGEASTD